MGAKGEAFRIVDLGTAEAVLSEGGRLEWIPLRRNLGVRAFGTNAFRAARAGDPVIEGHVESPGQEELYVVVSGAARMTIGDEEIDAPAGTVVFVPDPGVRRGAVALEDGTLVLAVGGWPEKPYHSLPWEPIYMAQEAMRAEGAAAAADVLEREAGEHTDRPIVQFRLACYRAQAGAPDEALGALRRAVEADPAFRERARSEEQLVPLRDLPEWAGLIM